MNRISQPPKNIRTDSADKDELTPIDALDKSDSPDERDSEPAGPKPKMGWLKKLFLIAFVCVILLALAVLYCVSEAQKVPEFYAAVLEHDNEISKVEGDKFERNLALLNNAFRRVTPWKLKFTQDEVNGWLSSDLDEKFGDLVPKEISDPRVVFTEHDVRIAFKYEKKGMKGIVVATCDIFCTENENEFAIKLLEVRSGVVKLPIGPWLERITEGFQFAGIDVSWSDEDNKPVALIQMPDQLSSNGLHQYVILEAIDIRPGQLVIAGSSARKHTKPPTPTKQNPNSPVVPKTTPAPATPSHPAAKTPAQASPK